MNNQAFNPFLPIDTYIPDGEPHVFGDRIYLFGSHDKEAGDTYCMLDYEIWSAPVQNLSEWNSKGINYSATQDPLYDSNLRYMYAPDCVRGNDGRYYLYYCMSGYRGRGGYSNPISVAVCDTPDGRYEYLGTVKNKDGTPLTRYVCFDPAVINDNGVIRLYYGTDNPMLNMIPFRKQREMLLSQIYGRTREQLHAAPDGITGAFHVTLSDDMMTVTAQPKRIDASITEAAYKRHKFYEGSSIRKVDNIYYFIYSSTLNHELCYATSQHPDRDFHFGGTIISNGDIGYQGRKAKDRLNTTGTNHGSIECVNGQWYVFYHRLTHHSDYSRQACAEKAEILPNGNIPQVEMSSCGLNGKPLAARGRYPAVICCNLTNGKMTHGSNRKKELKTPCVTSGDGERYIRNITNKTLIGYKYFDFPGTIRVTLQTRGNGSGRYELLAEETGSVLGSIPVKASAQWQETSGLFSVSCGTHPLYLCFRGKGNTELLSLTLST